MLKTTNSYNIKGHINKIYFAIFKENRIGIGHLTYCWNLFDFGFEFAETAVLRNHGSTLATLGIADSFELKFYYKYMREFAAKSKRFQQLTYAGPIEEKKSNSYAL